MKKSENGRNIGSETQLFVDGEGLSSKQGVVRTLHPGRKLIEPVLLPERPWEVSGDSRRVYIYGTVIYDQASKLFRMWYMGRMNFDHGHKIPGLYKPFKTGEVDALGRRFAADDVGDLMLYATSKDGIHWKKPNLGLFEFDDSPDNNIVWDFHGASVLVDEAEEDPGKRFKMVGFCRRFRDIRALYSADGLTWQEFPENPIVEREHEGSFNVVHDPLTGNYLASALYGHEGKRCVALFTSRDFHQGWSKPKMIVVPDTQDDTWVENSDQSTQFYGMSGFRYGGQFLGLLNVFRVQRKIKDQAPGDATDDGPIDVQLTHSRDGLHWERFEDRSAIIPNGRSGAFDAGCILQCATEPVICEDEVWVYYTAINTTHGGLLADKLITIGRASWRLDGFVSLDAGSAGGMVETVPIRSSGGSLEVNVDASHGHLRVEIVTAEGDPLPGYRGEDCAPMQSDGVRQVAHWNGADRLPEDQPVRLRFHLCQAQLYSFRMESSK